MSTLPRRRRAVGTPTSTAHAAGEQPTKFSTYSFSTGKNVYGTDRLLQIISFQFPPQMRTKGNFPARYLEINRLFMNLSIYVEFLFYYRGGTSKYVNTV